MDSSGHSIFGSYLGLIFLVSLPSAILACYINNRKKKFPRIICTDCIYFIYDLDAFIQYGFLRIRCFGGVCYHAFYWFSFDSGSLSLHTYSIVLCLSGETVEGFFDFSVLYFISLICRYSGMVCGKFSSDPFVDILGNDFDDSSFLSSSSLSPLHQTKSVSHEILFCLGIVINCLATVREG